MRIVRRLFSALLLITALFFALNFSWTHAGVAWLMTKSHCPAKLKALAQKDVARLYGRASASPLWLCLSKPLLGLDISHGTTRSALFFPSIIVIGKKGPRRNVMAHEYSHAELAARMRARYFLIPTWFDEGLAMQLDFRRAYSRKALARYLKRPGIPRPRLDQLTSASRFYKRGQARVHYAFASCVVGRWLKSQGKTQPLELINDVGWRKSFPTEQFRKFERRCLRG